MMAKKLCTRCGLNKDAAKFSRRSSSRDDLQSYCKSCNLTNWYTYKEKSEVSDHRRAYVKAYNARPDVKALRLKYMEGWYRASPRQTLRGARLLALRRRPTDNPVTLNELSAMFDRQNGRCAVSGLTMTWRKGEIKPTSITIDRIDSSGGY